MRIAYIVPSLINRGPIIVVKNLVHFLVSKTNQIDVFYFDETTSTMHFDCPTQQINMKEPIDFDFYDVIHSHCYRSDKYVMKWRKNIHKARTISTLHQDTYESFRFQYNTIISYLLTFHWCNIQSGFDAIIAISDQLNNTYIKRLKGKVTTIHNGLFINIDNQKVDMDAVDLIEKLKRKNYKILGTYAYVTKRKGISQIIKSLTVLKDYALIIIGEGPGMDELKSLSVKLKIVDRVLFLPFKDEPYNYLQFFDVYTMTSYSEGFGLAMVEAALAKKSIVCSDIPSFHEIFSDKNAVFFQLDNIDSLCNAIVSAYKNKDINGKAVYEKVIVSFTASVMAENHLIFYEKVIKGTDNH